VLNIKICSKSDLLVSGAAWDPYMLSVLSVGISMFDKVNSISKCRIYFMVS
jgi:hypothetical protein